MFETQANIAMNKQAALVALALLIAGGVSFAAVQQGQRAGDGPQEHTRRFERVLGQRHALFGDGHRRRQRGRELLRSLDVSESQKEQARAVAQSLQPIVDELRPRVVPLLKQARDLVRNGDREAARELLETELRPIRKDALARAKPLVQPLVGTLSPEQRAKLEAAAAARGGSFDEERFTKRLAWMLARHGMRR